MKSEITSIQSAKAHLKAYSESKCYCEILGGNQQDRDFLSESYDLVIIARALRLEYSIKNKLTHIWTPDWNDGKPKYFCYFDMRGSGSGFADAICNHWDANTDVGSRLCFPTEDLAKYFGQNFTDKHKIVMFEPLGWPVRGQEISGREAEYKKALENILSLCSKDINIEEIAKKALGK